MDKLIRIATRALSVAVVAFLSAWTITAPFGADTLTAGLVAAGSVLVMVIRDLAIYYANDGKLTDEEIEEAFRYVNDESNSAE